MGVLIKMRIVKSDPFMYDWKGQIVRDDRGIPLINPDYTELYGTYQERIDLVQPMKKKFTFLVKNADMDCIRELYALIDEIYHQTVTE